MLQSGTLLRLKAGAKQFSTRQTQRLMQRMKAARSYATVADATANDSNLLVRFQVDKGFWQGSALLGILLGIGYLVPVDTQANMMTKTVKAFRSVGVTKENIPDKALMNDFFRRNLLAFYNVTAASPAFYFLWHLVHNAGFVTSSVRSLTGTVRIVPFLAVLYGGCATLLPLGTNFLMNRGLEYKDASLKAAAGGLFSVMAILEALAELRGCGVTFQQMNVPSLVAFAFALIGRLATGVLIQQQKIGKEFENALPASWKGADGMQGSVYKLFDTMCIDTDFFKTLVGTSVFQHFLNAITFVLLTRGKATTLRNIGEYLTGGLNNSRASALQQFGRTVALRIGFCGCWNWLSNQTPPNFGAVDRALKILEAENLKK